MDNIKKIARMIENELGYTNGWKIGDEKYTLKCYELAAKIVSQMQLPVKPACEWIDFSIRPKSGQIILVKAGKIVTACEYIEEKNSNGEYYLSGAGFGGHEWDWDFNEKEVTHWMPIPKP